MKIFVFIITLFCILLYGVRYEGENLYGIFNFTSDPIRHKTGYNFDKPEKVFTLPQILTEVSGITVLNDTEIACVQDELGVVFIYDLVSQSIIREIPFSGVGDYEDIALVDSNLFVLRSDGALFEIENYRHENPRVNLLALDLVTSNNEGLCYDVSSKRLLIAAKSKNEEEKERKDERIIYGFDLNTKKLLPEPVLLINKNELIGYAEQLNLPLPEKEKKNGSVKTMLKFMPSCIGVQPHTKNKFVISAVDNSMTVFDKEGKIVTFSLLNRSIFNKAEGMTFLKNGDLLISNEGENKAATILKFRFKKK